MNIKDKVTHILTQLTQLKELLESRLAKDIIKYERKKPKNIETILESSIKILRLSTRINCCLLGEGIMLVSDLATKNKRQLFSIPNLGKKSLREIEIVLSNIGLYLKD